MAEKKALLGMHEEMYAEYIGMDLEDAGYEVTSVQSVEEMLEKMGIPPNSPQDAPPTNPFQLYIMDVNLGNYGGKSCEPALTVYNHIKPDVEEGKVKFLCITATPKALLAAREAGINCIDKGLDLAKEISDFIEGK